MMDRRLSSQVERLEAACARNPGRFAAVTGAWAVAIVATMLCAWVLALLGVVWAGTELVESPLSPWHWAVAAACGYILWAGMALLRSRPARASGTRLTVENAPKLFHLLGKVGRKTGAAVPQRIVLDGELRAHLLHRPRWGVMGGYRSTLVIGLPLLLCLDVKQFAAVVAHELAALGPTHGPLGAWVFRTRSAWAAQCEALAAETRHDLARRGLLFFFMRSVFPAFNRRALVLARHQALGADRVARRVAGTPSAMDALVTISVQSRYLGDVFWPEVFDRASHAPSPHVMPYRAMRMRMAKSHSKSAAWLDDELKRVAEPGDTVPALGARLARAKATARLSKPPRHSAAELLLADALDSLVDQMDERWQLEVAPRWGQMHRHQLAQHRLEQELQAEGEKGALDPDDHILWARAARTVQGDAAFEALLRLMLIDHPQDATARLELGLLLSDKPEEAQAREGLQMLRALALDQDNPSALAAAQRYGQWLAQAGEHEDRGFWNDEVRRIEHLAQHALVALNDFDSPQHWLPTDLSPRTLRHLRERLGLEEHVTSAYLVKKVVAAFPGWRFAVLLVEMRHPQGSRAKAARMEALRRELAVPCPFVLVDADDAAWESAPRRALVQKLKQTPHARVYARAAQAEPGLRAANGYMPA